MAGGVIACLLAGLLPSVALAASAPPPPWHPATPPHAADTQVKERIRESVTSGETLPEPGTIGGKTHAGPAGGRALPALAAVNASAAAGSASAVPHYTYARSISGQVSAGGSGLAGVEVDVYGRDGRAANWVLTGAGGAYTITVPAGTWYLYFYDGSNVYGSGYLGAAGFTYDPALATPITIAASDAAGLNVTLPAGLHIQGTLSCPGDPTKVRVTAYDSLTGVWMSQTFPDGSGHYSVAVPPSTYLIRFTDISGMSYVGYWTNGGALALAAQNATLVTVSSGDRTGIDMTMPSGLAVSGTVSLPGGSTQAGIEVDAWDTSTLELIGVTTTTAGGAYTLHLPVGNYYIEFWDATRTYPDGYWTGSGFTDEFHAASPVYVVGNMAGINVQLPAGNLVSGTVTNGSSLPVTGIRVRFYNGTDGWLVAVATTTTAGTYSVALKTGSYYMVLSDNFGVFSTAYWTGGPLSLDVDDAVPMPVGGPTVVNVQLTSAGTLPGTYVPLTPTRLLDTRDGTGALSGPFTNHAARSFQVAGRGGVPTDAVAITGNLTVTGQTSNGYLFLGPSQADNPTSSTLNFPMGDDRANGVTVALGSDGKLWVTFVAPRDGPSAHAIFDVTGYFIPGSGGSTYHALAPTRLLDTRDGTGGLATPFANHSSRGFQVAGRGGIPANAVAVTGNLTVTGQTSRGYLFVGPSATDNPTSSTLNFPTGDDRANGVTVALGSGGTLALTFVAPTNGPTAHAIFDVTGYFTPDASGARYVALNPGRLLDSRDGTGGIGTPFTNHVSRWFYATGRAGVPTNAVAVTGNLTVTGQTSKGYLFVGPLQTNAPTSSTLNFPVGDDRANGVTVAVGAYGELWVTFVAPTSGPSAHAIFDVTGYFAG